MKINWHGLRKFLGWLALSAVLTLLVMTALPHDKAIRYSDLPDRFAPTSEWIYRRIHDDRTPIDIAFIGTSRTGMGINSERLEQDLAKRGTKAHAVNFHIVRTGRNLHYAVAKELLQNRKVKLLVVELTEVEDRLPHPDFIYLANTSDVIFAPLLINLGYLPDIARLPGRQAGLFVETLLARTGLRAPQPSYQGEHLDHSEVIETTDGKRHWRNVVNSPEKMEQLRLDQDKMITKPVLPAWLEGLEFRIPRYYIDEILALAKAHDTAVAFVYLPRYKAPEQSAIYDRLYSGSAPLINPAPPIVNRTDIWEDAVHTNWTGAQIVTDQIAAQIVDKSLLK